MTPNNMSPLVAALMRGTVRAAQDIADISGKLAAMALVLTPRGTTTLEANRDSDLCNPDERLIAIESLRIELEQVHARVVVLCAPVQQANAMEFYAETITGDSWLGRSFIHNKPDGKCQLLDPVWFDGAKSEFHPLIHRPKPKHHAQAQGAD